MILLKEATTTAQRQKNDEWFCSFCLTERPLIRRSRRFVPMCRCVGGPARAREACELRSEARA